MAFNYSDLNGAIVAKFGTQYNFAQALGISEHSLSKKLNNKVPWKQVEIAESVKLLGIKHDDIAKYFFTLKVQ